VGVDILVADDTLTLRVAIARGLERDGHRVTTVRDCLEAVEKGSTEPFDVLVFAVEMPDLDGISALNAIRSVKPAIPAVVMSAASENEARALQAGATRFVLKSGDFLTSIRDTIRASAAW
jgi:two-component system, OmpR family, response regulator